MADEKEKVVAETEDLEEKDLSDKKTFGEKAKDYLKSLP